MEDREPTARARELGLLLGKAAADSKFSGAALSRWLGWSQAKVSRIFTGTRPASSEDVIALAAVCRVKAEERKHLLRLAKEVHELNWLQEFGDRLPPALRTLVDYERESAEIVEFEANLVPGLLQTPDYARALMQRSATIPAEEVEDRVSVRRKRREIFAREHRPTCRFFIDELALVRTGPGREILGGQLHHLLEMSVRPYIEIRVIPDAVGFHPGKKPFRVMEFFDLNPVVFMEDETGAQFLQQKDTVTAYRQVIKGLAAVALNEGQSRDWIASVASTLGAPQEEQDDLAEEQFLGQHQLR
jgi:hypothetical protein